MLFHPRPVDFADGKGFTLKNVGTGKYLKDAGNANHDEPTYFSFCTLATTTAINDITITKPHNSTLYDLMGRRVDQNTLRPGIYIKNGRKVMKRL